MATDLRRFKMLLKWPLDSHEEPHDCSSSHEHQPLGADIQVGTREMEVTDQTHQSGSRAQRGARKPKIQIFRNAKLYIRDLIDYLFRAGGVSAAIDNP